MSKSYNQLRSIILTGLITIGVKLLTFPVMADGITNPLSRISSPQQFITNIIKYLLGLSALLAFAAIIYGGIRLVASFGSENNVRTGKSIITWAIIGLVVIILSYTMLSTVTRLLGVQ